MLVFQSRRPGGAGGSDLWFSKLENGRWAEAVNAGAAINTAADEFDGKLSPDGRTLVFIRNVEPRKTTAVYIAEFRNGAWSAAKAPEPVSIAGAIQYGAVLAPDGKRLYFSSNRSGGHGGFDHYYSDRTPDGWSQPVNLGQPVNSSADEVDLALLPGGGIVFPLRRADSMLNSVDLYISRPTAGAWSSPVNLGPRINTPGTDTCPWVSSDGRSLYLDSDWNGLVAGQKGERAVWVLHHSEGF
jgi:hypothetical protein